MTLLADVSERRRIADLAQQALDRRQPRAYRIEADAENVLHEDDWYQVLVTTTPRDIRTYEFYEVLAEAEAELQDEKGLHILLVPVAAD